MRITSRLKNHSAGALKTVLVVFVLLGLNAGLVSEAAAVDCRPLSTRPLAPPVPGQVSNEILIEPPSAVLPSDNMPEITFKLFTERHALFPGVAPSACPGSTDGVVVVLERSINVQSATVNYFYPGIAVVKIVPFNPHTDVQAFIRYKYEQDFVIRRVEIPRKKAVIVALFLSQPTVGNTIGSQYQLVNE